MIDWTHATGFFTPLPGATGVQVTAYNYLGAGKVQVDDIVLLPVDLPAATTEDGATGTEGAAPIEAPISEPIVPDPLESGAEPISTGAPLSNTPAITQTEAPPPAATVLPDQDAEPAELPTIDQTPFPEPNESLTPTVTVEADVTPLPAATDDGGGATSP
ncbi:MAG: hypothetical protein IPK16_12125 [Anaerolineales bacterium]|nr:hypothetical protein [Anaerolineales bacterium]